MHAKRRTRAIRTFAGEKQLVAGMIDEFLKNGWHTPFITAVEDLSVDIYAEGTDSATVTILSEVVHQLTMRNTTNLRQHLVALATYLRESPNESIECDALVERIVRSAK